MKYHHNPALPWRNPESVPLDKIPDGWRLMLPGEEGSPANQCRIRFSDKFSTLEYYKDNEGKLTCIIPATVPLPEEFRFVQEPEIDTRPVANIVFDPSKIELRVHFAGLAMASLLRNPDSFTADPEASAPLKTWEDIAKASRQIADAMIRELEVKP